MNLITIVFYHPSAFLNLLVRNEEDANKDDFPLLRQWVKKLRQRYDDDTTTYTHDEEGQVVPRIRHVPKCGATHVDNNNGQGPPRIILVLYDVQAELHRRWNHRGTTSSQTTSSSSSSSGPVGSTGQGRSSSTRRRRQRRRSSFEPTNEDELHDAIMWMLTEERIECQLPSSMEETSTFLTNMTRALSEMPYAEEVTELHCVKKLKSHHGKKCNNNSSSASQDGGGGGGNVVVTALDRARDCWRRQVQQIPGISESKAVHLVRHYPTCRSLMEQYQSDALSMEQKKMLLTTCFSSDAAAASASGASGEQAGAKGRKKGGGGKNYGKLSEMVYQFMTSDDPMELIL